MFKGKIKGKGAEFLVEGAIKISGIASIIIVVLIFLFLLRDGLSLFKFVSLKEFIR